MRHPQYMLLRDFLMEKLFPLNSEKLIQGFLDTPNRRNSYMKEISTETTEFESSVSLSPSTTIS